MSAPKKTLSEANRRMVELIVWGQVPSAIEGFLATRSTTMKRADATRESSRIWRSVPAQRYAEELRGKMLAQRQRKLARRRAPRGLRWRPLLGRRAKTQLKSPILEGLSPLEVTLCGLPLSS